MSQAVAARIEARYRDQFPRSAELYRRGCEVFPSGVTHDGRYLQPFPIYVERSAGGCKYAVDGQEIIDCWSGHGALLLGHSYEPIITAVQQQMARGTHWSACHELEIEWGERVIDMVPSAEMVRFTSSGTEATLMALRVARIVSGRSAVIKLAGHFHGWHDQLIPGADPPHADHEYATPGVTEAVYGDLVVVPPNDLEAIEHAIVEHRPACVILEPTGGRWGVVPIRGDYLRGLREITSRHGVLLVFDEVITGFRVAPGGAQEAYAVTPDLTTLAKILAGGLPGGCLAGRRDLMEVIAFDNPLGRKMKHPGTFNGNPLSAVAGIAALDAIRGGVPCERATATARLIRARLNELFTRRSANWVAYGDFSFVKIHPDYSGDRPDADEFLPFGNDYMQLDRKHPAALSHAFRCALLLGGVDWMGWHGMINAAHTDAHVDRIVEAFDGALEMLRGDGLVD